MKRIHLIEVEDQAWFPNWLRIRLTRLIIIVHRWLGSSEALADLLARALKKTEQNKVVDLCSGSGGPLPEVAKLLREKHGINNLEVTMTDLYPNVDLAEEINSDDDPSFSYETTPMNATSLGNELPGLRTMICSMHHMKPDVARQILQHAKDQQQPICIYELSDNSFPLWLNVISLPLNIIQCLIITPFVRPMTWQQLVFTYLIPIMPLAFAWDGSVSNVRTYTLSDLDELLDGLSSDDYSWEKGILKGRGRQLYLLGMPKGK